MGYGITVDGRVLNNYLNNGGSGYGVSLDNVRKTLNGVMQVKNEWYISSQKVDVNFSSGVPNVVDYDQFYIKVNNGGFIEIGSFDMTFKNCMALTIKPLENDNRLYGLKIENKVINTATMLIPRYTQRTLDWKTDDDVGTVTIGNANEYIALREIMNVSRMDSFDIFQVVRDGNNLGIYAQMYYEIDDEGGRRGNYRNFPRTTTTFRIISR